jgi:hypothetical protein
VVVPIGCLLSVTLISTFSGLTFARLLKKRVE